MNDAEEVARVLIEEGGAQIDTPSKVSYRLSIN